MIVSGPNRFQRRALGTTAGAVADLEVTTRIKARARRVVLELTNGGTRTLEVRVRPLAYSRRRTETVALRPGRSHQVEWDASTEQGWYDLEVAVTQDKTFGRRLTGHIENGRASVAGRGSTLS